MLLANMYTPTNDKWWENNASVATPPAYHKENVVVDGYPMSNSTRTQNIPPELPEWHEVTINGASYSRGVLSHKVDEHAHTLMALVLIPIT